MTNGRTEASRKKEMLGLIAIRILSDAFFTKCGFLAAEMLATETENQEWRQLPQDRGNGTRVQCVFHNADRLRNEADLSMSELRIFMNMKVAVNPERMLLRSEQNKAAHSLSVGLMAYQLQRVFRASPDSERKNGFTEDLPLDLWKMHQNGHSR